MTGYDDGADKILVILRALTNFDSNNTSSGDWTVLDQGQNTHYAITKPSIPTFSEKATMTRYHDHYSTIVEVWQFMEQDLSDEAILDELNDRVKEVVDGIRQYNRLNDTGDSILDAEARISGEVEEISNNLGALEWLMQEVTVEWIEEREYAYQD